MEVSYRIRHFPFGWGDFCYRSRGIWDGLWFSCGAGQCGAGEWALGYNSMGFWDFSDISLFPKILSLKSSAIREATLMYQFITNNHTSFHLWWKKNLLNHQNILKYYQHDCGSMQEEKIKYDCLHIALSQICNMRMLIKSFPWALLASL